MFRFGLVSILPMAGALMARYLFGIALRKLRVVNIQKSRTVFLK